MNDDDQSIVNASISRDLIRSVYFTSIVLHFFDFISKKYFQIRSLVLNFGASLIQLLKQKSYVVCVCFVCFVFHQQAKSFSTTNRATQPSISSASQAVNHSTQYMKYLFIYYFFRTKKQFFQQIGLISLVWIQHWQIDYWLVIVLFIIHCLELIKTWIEYLKKKT